MNNKSITIPYIECGFGEELDEKDNELLNAAKEATKLSYAPYSGFCVGAALRLANGEIISASNQENAAYPSGLCAERVAIFYANSKYPDVAVESLAVTAAVDGKICEMPTYPCGACRQVIAESEKRFGKRIRIIAGGEKIIQIIDGINGLLPFAFDNLPR
ncbi:MAG TPA: cytidine deaminase [Bacteroidales bacterium]|jgi:cytidine deaminase|nr:cytidine deaminase [Bacteroidales bacterium]